MKSIFTSVLLIICVGVFGQKKGFVWPKPIRDSQWTEVRCDTIFGTIEYKVDGGEIISDGCVVECNITDWSMPIYSRFDSTKISNHLKRDSIMFITGFGASGIGQTQNHGYAILNGKYKSVYNYKFTVKNKK